MFFFWFTQHRQFSRKKNLSGQIVPFLLVALVVLLIAAIATINIGRVSLDKTCSANAADAGALAAASAWASAFNKLTEINMVQLKKLGYDNNYYLYGQLYFEADNYLKEAKKKAEEASAYAAAAIGSGKILPGGNMPDKSEPDCTSIWYRGMGAATADYLAASAALDASIATRAFGIIVGYMQSLTDSFYEQQRWTYCNARDFMADAYLNARKTGLSYAFNNSCIPGKLSEGQSDAFSVWMSSGTAYSEDGVPFSGTAYPDDTAVEYSRTCTWQDKIDQAHTVSVSMNLPKITSYELQHTQANYSQIKALLDGLISDSQSISEKLSSTAVVLGSTAAMFIATFASSIATFVLSFCKDKPLPYNCYPAWSFSCVKVTWWLYGAAHLAQSVIINALTIIIGVAAAVSLGSLEDDNDKAFDGWGPDGMRTSASCADAEDLMIVKINDVNLTKDATWPNDWTAFCSTNQVHPGTSSGILATEYPAITSSSRAKFDVGGRPAGEEGRDVGDFNDIYDASIVDTK